MKVKLLLLVLLFFQCSLMFGQNLPAKKDIGKSIKGKSSKVKPEPTLEVIYDFETQKYTSNELKPRHKQPVVLKITNINKIANTVSITSNDVKINDDFLNSDEKQVSSILANSEPVEDIKINDALNIEVKVPKEINDESSKKTLKNKSRIDELKKQLYADYKDVENKNTQIKQKSKDISVANGNIESINSVLKSDTTAVISSEIKTKLANLSTSIDELQKDQTTLSKEIDSTKSNIRNKESELAELSDELSNFKYQLTLLTKSFTEFNSNIKDINRINAAYNNYIDYIINPNLTYDQYSQDAASICAILNPDKKNDYYKEITDFDMQYSDFMEKYDLVFNDMLYYEIYKQDESYANLIKAKFDLLKSNVESTYAKVNVTELRKKVNNTEIINNVLSKKKAFTIVSNPVQPLEDYVEFNVKIRQNTSLGNSIVKENEKDFNYMEYVRRGVRWDVSIGTVFDFGIKNQEYELKDNGNNEYEITENNTSQYTPTIAGILHTSFRTNNMFAFGVSLGVSINATDFNFNSFFPGISLLIGKREKMVLTAGPAFKKVKQIKSIYADDRILTQPIQNEDITSDQFKIGYFFGISYNLTNKQKSRIKTLK